ncbi:MAG: glycosyltransferase family 39 protein [Syntrophorhabdaceae bacterium]|nr:glycosyltransferase family 39 protein [Syntrophorhabdaceae bacterium]
MEGPKIDRSMDKRYLLIIVLMSWMFFFSGLGAYSLKEPDEGRYAEIPREMVETGDYLVPHLNYVRYFEKPPLFYWTVAASYKISGINEWSFRIPNALSAFICVILTYIFSRRWFNSKIAFFSSMILASSFGFFSMARIVTLDMFFTLWLSCSLFLFYEYYKDKKPFFIYLFYICLALATLTKGIVVIILMLITIFIFLITEKRLDFIKEMKPLKGIIVYLVVALPWFITISMKEKEFFYFFFIDQHFLRFFTSKHKRTGSILYFFPVLFGGLFPWSFFLPRAVVNLWKRKEIRLFLIWSIVVFAFFSISSSKLPPYILPIFPAMALVLGVLFGEKDTSKINTKWEILPFVLIFVAIISIPFLYNTEIFLKWVEAISDEAPLIISELKVFFIILAATSFFALLFLLMSARSIIYRVMFFLLVIFSFVFICNIIIHRHIIDRLNTTKDIALALNERKSDNDLIVNYGSYDQTLTFYIKKRIIIVNYRGELDMGAKYEDAKGYFIDEDEFLRIARSNKRAFFVIKEKKLAYVKDRLFRGMTLITCKNDRCLYTNH